MKRKLLTLLLVLSMLVMVAWTPPTAQCFACTADQRKQCHDEAELLIAYCMIVYGSDTAGNCSYKAAEYEERCLTEKGCPLIYKVIPL